MVIKEKNHCKNIKKKKIRKIKNLKLLNESIKKIVFSSFFIVGTIAAFAIGCFAIFSHKTQAKADSDEISYTSNLYQSQLSQQLAIVANSNVFLQFLRSGEKTRDKIYADVLREIFSIKEQSISGMVLTDLKGRELLSFGKKTPVYVILNLCYLGTRLDQRYGQCNNKWQIFFSENNFIYKIKSINKNITVCKGFFCKKTNLLDSKNFGTFYVIEKSSFFYSLTIVPQKSYLFLVGSCLFFLALIALAFWNKVLITKILNDFIAAPLLELTEKLKKAEKFYLNTEEIEEIIYLKKQIIEYQKKENLANMAEVVNKIAHDIRSPLAAMEVSLSGLTELSEEKRIFLRNAVYRVHDIANNLMKKFQDNYKSNKKKSCNIELQLLSIIDPIISEKRTEFRNLMNISIVTDFNVDSYGIFCKINSSEIKTVISNLINNSVEAIGKVKGIISIELYKKNELAQLVVKDDGPGIPEAIKNLIGQKGVTYGKDKGNGLGLYHAIKSIESLNGILNFSSPIGHGTTITIFLPLVPDPAWFLSSIKICNNMVIVILDDDATIHQVWEERFYKYIYQDKVIKLMHFSKEDQLNEWINTSISISNVLFLIDYEILHSELNGIDLIKKYEITTNSILVTSRHEEEEVHIRCKEEQIFLLPKPLAALVPIKKIDD